MTKMGGCPKKNLRPYGNAAPRFEPINEKAANGKAANGKAANVASEKGARPSGLIVNRALEGVHPTE